MVWARGLEKYLGGRPAVEGVSLEVAPGEVLGLVGPNGAGKTTTLRLLLGILTPDAGEVRLFGRPPDDAGRARVGYLPEERGLYPDLPLEEVLDYLAELRGMEGRDRWDRIALLLERVGLWPHRRKRVRELSRGMLQMAQFVGTVLHRPRLAVLDEPFANLDPLNTRLLKEMVTRLREEGTAFILSSHQMQLVEEMCDRLVMLHRGRGVLYGSLGEIKARFAARQAVLDTDLPPEGLEGVVEVRRCAEGWLLTLAEGAVPGDLLRAALARGMEVRRFAVREPTLEEVFLAVVAEGRRA